ncbi:MULTISPECIES: EAL domain-containing protein [unclassified Chelatococcus]|uniref:putative bifunctional diguanylate cyclase/phosphodiesterase n=1 Tax=unclassified Chelatococcus TaxID=2638111 RepID=UPI001BCBEF5C|nr:MULTISPECIES: EAL domain-containing protein [unclassified Chelatococcus]CAH1667847.1 Diguanylate cyclase (GGDEF)-like protein [Hyphomicrobiales bacterium]MBS7738079.1 EAL domain-containing protein [Chelatococcus sp. HY11]MBX3546282.1 EAL domain-containing protein [Chelatococcus sp.]MCO5077576.1 EAL domain-containing protein [Chelatococcus sp.]CAH1679339.1 Diguanylate cyclase (GGDEF)-like protein [Hyphomicrobiales bacterium]
MLFSGFRIARPAALIGRLLGPIALIVVAVIAGMLLALVYMSDSIDEWSVAEHRHRLAEVLSAHKKKVEQRLDTILATTDLNSADLSRAASVPSVQQDDITGQSGVFEALVIADGSRSIRPVAAASSAPPSERPGGRESLEALVQFFFANPPSPGQAVEHFVYHDGAVYLLVAKDARGPAFAMAERAGQTVIIIYRYTIGDIEAIGRAAGTAPVTLVREPAPGHEVLPIKASLGGSMSLAWKPSLPSEAVWPRLAVIMALASVIALLALAVVWLVARRIAYNEIRMQDQSRRLAGQDTLSGLPNRLSFSMRLEQELARGQRSEEGLAVLFLDVDRFKDVNDIYGHMVGDNVIRVVAQRLQNLLRGADTLARLGGDEFAIIQTGVSAHHDAEALCRRILEAVKKPIELGDTTVSVGMSIGIVLSPQNGSDRETLLRLAGTALYQAKNSGRNRFSFVEREMDEALRLRKVVEDDLRKAIENDELVLHYQPQVEIDNYVVVAVEALVRWPHREHGLITPEKFIAIAEERGLIIALGEWVLRRACADAKRWPGVRIAINVSAIQFRHRDFVSDVMRIITESGIDPTRIELELTEGVVVEDADAAEEAMIELRAHGVRLALDDFGTGYSSLIYLRRFAFDKIKIDRSFLEAAETTGESAILIHSIVHLGRALGLTVTAEGVETQEQLEFLRALGCHELQGYLFSKPVTAEKIDELLAQPGVLQEQQSSIKKVAQVSKSAP